MRKIFVFGLMSLMTVAFLWSYAYPSPIKAQTNIKQFNFNDGAYVKGQFIIGFKKGMSPQALEAKAAERAVRGETVGGRLANIRENIRNRISGQQGPENTLASIQEVNNAVGFSNSIFLQSFENTETYVYKVNASVTPQSVLTKYGDLSAVAFIEPDGIAQSFKAPNDPDYSKLWAMPKIKAEDAWEITTGSNTVTVGIVDTGVQINHPDLQGNAQKSEAVSPACTVNGDRGSHGSHVAGTIGAVGNNSTGVVGINWTVKINGYGVLCSLCPDGRRGCGSFSDIITGVNRAVADNVDVINMSLGGDQPSDAMHQAVRNARNRGILVVVAAGNSSDNTRSFYPASYPEVMTVSATGPQDEFAVYSNFGNAVDIAAPGGSDASRACPDNKCIYSTVPPNGYDSYQGTSMASPHVAGAVALLLSVNPNLTPDQLQNALQCTSDDLGPTGWDEKFGHGRLNLKAAMTAVKSGNIPTCSSPAEPTSQPQPTSTEPTPTGTQPTNVQPTPTGQPHPCPAEAAKGNYNCDNVIDNNDYKSWEADFKSGVAPLAPWFEYIRKVIYNRL